jgi:uncharacterized lipoprotein YddW (UPF0748 family)
MPRIYFFFAVLLTLHGCGVLPSQHHTPKREFRGVWVASVANIDWPMSGWNGSAVQKADFTKILDFYHGLNFNAVIVQVRAAGDALYPSENAPWSRYISGREGRYAQWDEDPLAWMIKETHQRGMEFHAWFNPYRATVSLKTENLSPDHDFYQHPEWMLTYGNKNYYNPGLPEVRAKFNAVIAEVVSNYNIDAIHFDDYFYPYKIEGQQLQDSTIYKKYASPGQSLEDWRRSNVDSLVKGVHTTIKNIKPWVLFGISPFGVWKNKATDPRGSDTQAGQTTYEDLYADPLLWMKEGWIDYLAPQVYWSMDLPVASHKKIVDWWSKNTTGTTLYIGNGAYKIRNNSDAAWDKKTELPNQIALARTTSKVSGNIFFSAKSLMQENQDVVRYLKRKYYRFPALTPVQNIVNNKVPTPPKLLAITKNRDSIFIKIALQEPLKQALIYQSGRQKKESYPIRKLTAKLGISPNSETIAFPKSILHRKNFALVFLDRYGNETKPIILNVKKINQHD